MTQGEWLGLGVGLAVGAFILRDLLNVKPDVSVGAGTLTGDGAFTQAGVAAFEASKQCTCPGEAGTPDYACPCDELPLGALGGMAAAEESLGVVGGLAAAEIVGDARL